VEAGQSVTVTPWEVLHALGPATVLSRQGAGRGLAEHWGCLKYCQALEGSSGKYMKLSEEGLNPRRHYKTVQSGELGIGFALAVAERIVRKRYPGHSVSLVDADIALQAGWALVGKDVRRRDWVRQRPRHTHGPGVAASSTCSAHETATAATGPTYGKSSAGPTDRRPSLQWRVGQ
jgi:hypothetical protein